MAAYEEKRDLIALGAYVAGSDARVDQAIAAHADVERFLRQDSRRLEPFETTVLALRELAEKYPDV